MPHIHDLKTKYSIIYERNIFSVEEWGIDLSNHLISNEDAAFITDLVQKFSKLMYSAASGCGPPGEAEDILSDAAVYLLGHVELLRSLKPPQQAVYLYKVVQHTAYNHGSRLRRRAGPLREDYAADDFTKEIENRAILHSALGKMKPQYRDILLFHSLWGYSVKEIAELMGMRPGTAGVYLQRARHQARRLLAEWKED